MSKQFYAVHLIPPRPDFVQTMTDEERRIMGQHVAYWTEKMNKGEAFAFGPVLDPKGVYGLGILSAADEAEVKAFIENDPAVKINRCEYFPMLAIVPNPPTS